MSFTLKIYLMGLIALVPEPQEGRMTLLLVDARPAEIARHLEPHHLEPHLPLLVTDASCTGDCALEEVARREVAHFLAGQLPAPQLAPAAHDIYSALARGGAWRLDQEELTLSVPPAPEGLHIQPPPQEEVRVPRTVAQQEGFSWVADLDRIRPGSRLDAELLAATPPPGRIVARFRVDRGTVKTYRLARREGAVHPLEFRVPDGGEAPVDGYVQAFADAVVIEMEIRDDAVTFEGTAFEGSRRRSMTLSPEQPGENATVEVALVNVPFEAREPSGQCHHSPSSGRHFEAFFKLLAQNAGTDPRPVPHFVVPTGKTCSPFRSPLASPLLSALFPPLLADRGTYCQPICLLASIPAPESGGAGEGVAGR